MSGLPIAFHDTNVELIHTATDMHAVQKLQYLRSLLKVKLEDITTTF